MAGQRAEAPAIRTLPGALPGQLHAVGLLTEGLGECFTASARPAFSWQLAQPQDADPGRAVQTGYEIAVEDTRGTKFWSSGPVSSPAQRGVAYDGQALDDDTDYAWRVRVRDAAGNFGKWSEAKPFSTGLSDASWQADWIRRAPGGRAPLEVLEGALRVAGSPFLPVPCRPLRSFRLEARLRPVMGLAGLLLRSSSPGTGLLLELSDAGEVVLRHAPAWDIPALAVPDTAELARGRVDRLLEGRGARLPGTDRKTSKDRTPGGWQDLAVTDNGHTITVSLNGVELLSVHLPAVPGAAGKLALHQGPRNQAEYASLRVSSEGEVLLDHRFDAGGDHARACLAHWTSTTAHRQPDEWTLFRTTVQLTGTVRRARLFMAAHHHAQISLAGTHCLSTTSFGYPGEGYYDAADVTGLLAAHPPGSAVPLTALLHWYGPGQGRAAALPGLLVSLRVQYIDGRREVFGSGPEWSAGEAPYRQSGYRNDEGDPVEHLDGHAASLAGVLSSPSADGPAAISYGSHPTPEFPALHPRRTVLAEEFVAPAAFLAADDGTMVADFGQVLPGRPEVHFLDGVPGRTLMIRAGYGLTPGGRVDTGKTASQNTDMSFPYTQAAGPQQFRANVHLGFRYLELPGVEAAELSRVGAVAVHGRHPDEGSFTSSDPILDSVFKLLRDSALYGVQEQFVDTPTREKGQFLADAVNISYATMALFGEHAYTAQALREFRWSALRYWASGEDKGRYNAVYPNGDGKRDIPDFSLMMPEWVEEYHLRTGDLDLVRELLPHLCNTADYALRYIPAEGPTAGLVTRLGGGYGPYLHGIVDWPEPGRFGYDMECAAKTTVNAQAYSALLSTARLCSLGGDEDAAIRYASSARRLADAIRTGLRVDGVMVDGLHPDGRPSPHASQHATSFPLSLGITDPEFAAADARRLAALGMKQGPMTVHRLVRALLSQGLTDAVLDLLTRADQPGWARLLDRGATFTWEAWDLLDGTDYSQSHAWSASVVKEILEHLLGVRYTSAGGADVLIAPPLCRLDHAGGSVPTVNGHVAANWRREGGLIQLECTIPPGVTATVRLPAGSYTVGSRGNGATAEAAVVPFVPQSAGTARTNPGGSPATGREAVDFRIHPGTWTFTPSPDGL
ncbi:alpha-L-rhamnosidase [Pseudarthrobacter phenanthrenivorans]|uniref:family 78 glycoside hydrolase catalytic domain n=2 Tax=Pseudarthrobacter phenanthrenivorans TaxID=361575 RepID=UPI0011293C97|nr:family 78 glycoside hydrolase catalytic domain [Pseudarthrobacter phenanthrenivorans]TPV52400.1 alpha-L-rhamnosidase [Pseudarthrobacter phenanthrenivorans]